MNKKLFFSILTVPILLLIAGCAPTCTPEEIASFIPILEYPVNGSEVSHNSPKLFNWTHNESCKPDEYLLIVDNLGFYYTDGDTSEFNYGLGFSPGTQYDWIVRAAVIDDNNQRINGPPSDTWTFTTDGMCTSASELQQPVLIEPQFGEWLGNGQGPGPASVHIKWDYSGDCYPDSFQYQAASDPEFTNIITAGITDWNHLSENINVPRCARIYWHVQARIGNDKGEYSEPSRFTYSSISSCFQNQQSIDASLIKGNVFEDYCGATVPWVPEGVGIAPPCVFGEPYGVHANGFRARAELENEMTGEMDPAEIGIPGVVVDLGAGPCPSTGLDQAVTQQNGNYYFMVQSPGEYCVSVDKAKNPSLDHGIWTLPLTDQDITEATISFNPADDLMMQNFGWDKNDFVRIKFGVNFNSFCRFGDSKDHLAIAEVPAGAIIPIFARNEDATWFAAYVNGMRCFISIASGEPMEDPTGLQIFPVQPDPRPTADPVGSTGDPSKPTVDPCAINASVRDCYAAGCIWHPGTLSPGFCSSD